MIMTEEMLIAVKNLCDLMKEDPRYIAVNEAGKKYSDDPVIGTLLIEYQAQQTALTEEYAKDDRDSGVIDAIQNRINEIYREIIANPLYEAFKAASDEYEVFYKAVYDEMEFHLTGKRPGCTHDCSTCSGCH